MAGSPGFIPKAALTTSRVVYRPFLIPQRLNDSATLVGAAAHNAFGGTMSSIGQAYVSLQPKGPAKLLIPLIEKSLQATKQSMEIADRNKKVFWDPFSAASESMGRAIAGPGAYYYARKAGFPDPSNPDIIKGLLNLKLFQYPMPSGAAPAPQPQAPPPPTGGAQDAGEGAGQAAA
jgi:hypothetical protein